MRGMTETITLWHKSRVDGKDTWQRTIIPNCCWESDVVRTVSGNTASLASTFIALLPASLAGEVSVGDLVAKGAQTAEITGVTPHTEALVRTSLLPQVFTVKTVYDGTAEYKQAPHIEIEGV